jgi:hypothetical protein
VLGFDRRADLLDRGAVAEAVQDDIGAVGRERARDREADAARGAGDDGDFTFQHGAPREVSAGMRHFTALRQAAVPRRAARSIQ